ncbi:MAG: cytochrome P460 family protein [Myxococcota bacterium]|nr:cytochrome P460 family protein [Myxococcota bacterium]
MGRALVFCLMMGCGEPLRDEVTPVTELDYKAWKQVHVEGDAPGHTGFRTIYANDLARDPTQAFVDGYQEGAIFVKEVFNDAARTDRRHVAVMRRIGDPDDDGGWYFTEAKGDGPEEHYDFCFRRCHAAAPYKGAWFDYRDE